MLDDELMEKGCKAEQAKEYLDGLINEATTRLSEQLLNLYPDETIKFSVIRSQMMSLQDIVMVVQSDINAGKEALERIQNPAAEQKGGIL